jgi:hypothetical protein
MAMSWQSILASEGAEQNPQNPQNPLDKRSEGEKEGNSADLANIAHGGKSLKVVTSKGDIKDKLRRLAKWRNHSYEDLLVWYMDDLDYLATLTNKQLERVVCEYIDNQHLCRPFKPSYVICGTCTHFQPIAQHHKMGRCGAGKQSNAGTSLFWDTGLRSCDKYSEAT